LGKYAAFRSTTAQVLFAARFWEKKAGR